MSYAVAEKGFDDFFGMDELFEISRCLHCDMVSDEDRVEKYGRSIERLLLSLKSNSEPTHVLDIGTGTGLLAMITAHYSPDRITACEACPPFARLACEVINKNGLQDMIHVIAKSSWELKSSNIGGRADVAIAEIFDTELIGEGALRTFALAHRDLLKRNCHVLPSKATVYVRAIESAYISNWFRLDPSLRSFGIRIPSEYTICPMGPQAMNVHFRAIPENLYTFVTDKVLIFEFNFNNAESLLLRRSDALRVPLLNPSESRCIDALVLWWELDMLGDGSVVISTDPHRHDGRGISRREHWLQALYGVRIPLTPGSSHCTLPVAHDEFSFRFSPNCSCTIHRVCSFAQMSKLNDRMLYADIIEKLKEDFRGRTVAFVCELSFLPLIALRCGSSKVYCWFGSEESEKILLNTALANGFRIGTELLIVDRRQHMLPEEVDSLFCDLTFQLASQSWHALEFWQTFCRLVAASEPRKDRSIYPSQGKIYCVVVNLLDHWKFRSPARLPWGIDISLATDLVQKAVSTVDAGVESSFMWEYPGTYMSCPLWLCDVATGPPESIVIEKNISLQRDLLSSCVDPVKSHF